LVKCGFAEIVEKRGFISDLVLEIESASLGCGLKEKGTVMDDCWGSDSAGFS
jgi:hypothetical protein